MNETLNAELSVSATDRTTWAGRSLPLTHERVANLNLPKNTNIGIALDMDAKLATVCLSLQDQGNRLSVYCDENITDETFLEYLKSKNIDIYHDVEGFIESNLDVILGADVKIAQAQNLTAKGLTLTSADASAIFEKRRDAGQDIPHIIDLSRSKLRGDICESRGVGQSAVMTFLDVSNLQVAGRKVFVLGYDPIGQGVAEHAAAMGARITVAESDTIAALQAVFDGHDVGKIDDVAAQYEVVFLTSKTGVSMDELKSQLELMPDRMLICNVSPSYTDTLLAYLKSLDEPKTVRGNVAEYVQANGKTIRVLCGGYPIHSAAGEGLPAELGDIALAMQMEAMKALYQIIGTTSPTVTALPSEIETELARAALKLRNMEV